MATRTHQLQLRVTEAEKRAIRTASERAGMGMSEWILARALPEPRRRLAALMGHVTGGSSQAAWAEIIELLQGLAAIDFPLAVDGLEVDFLPLRERNYVAALVEMTAARLGCPPPAWAARVPPLPHPWFGTRLRRLREHLLVSAPVAFRRRNLFIDAAVGDRA